MEYDFKFYVEKVTREIKKLENLILPPLNSWQIEWDKIDEFSKDKKWLLSPFNELREAKKSPFVYYFTISSKDASRIYDSLINAKLVSSEARIKSGVGHKDFRNISHVPKSFKKSNCLYVGSVKNDLYGRLIAHLGYGANRTGSMHLKFALENIYPKPKITFNYYHLDNSYRNVTEHLESILYDELKPLIGKRGLRSFSEE